MDKPNDVLFSGDLNELRLEIVRLRSLVDSDSRVTELYRVRCEHLENIVQQFISHEYGKNS